MQCKCNGDAALHGTALRAAQESEFALSHTDTTTSLAAGAAGGAGGNETLSLADLMAPLQSSTEFAGVKKKIAPLTKDKAIRPLSEPAPETVSDRQTRSIAYEQVNSELQRWVPVVKQNREAEHLSFPLKPPQRHVATTTSLATKFTPTNSLERDLDAILTDLGVTESALKAVEAQQLSERSLTPEEIAKRQIELRKMKEVMFFAEQKAKQKAKIKSKKYRKLQKKEREKSKLSLEELRAIDPDLAAAEEQKLSWKRAKERMTLAHTNRSKWVKHQLERGPALHPALPCPALPCALPCPSVALFRACARCRLPLPLTHYPFPLPPTPYPYPCALCTARGACCVVRAGVNVDKEAREAVHEQLRLGQQLRAKMDSIKGAGASGGEADAAAAADSDGGASDDSDSGSESGSDAGEDAAQRKQKKLQKLDDKLKQINAEIEA
jgi:U3 small nucleolar RNA-associated protein 14